MTRNVTAGTVIVSEQHIVRQAHGTTPSAAWTLFTRDAGVGSFVGGPGSVPSGIGSLQLSTPGGTDKAYLFNYGHVGTRLSDITALSYRTYRSAGSAQQVAALNVEIDYNGDAAGGYAILVFEPVYNTAQGSVQSGVWQTWDAVSGGEARWWSAHSINGGCAFSCYLSWADLKAANPDAVIIGGFGVNQGGGNPGLVSAVDLLSIGHDGSVTTYDFEPKTLGSCWVAEDVDSQTLTLQADCVTSQTVLVPDGWTLDGNGHSITGVDPAGGYFLGAVVKNGGKVANVKNLTVTVSNLAATCKSGDDRLRGILLDGAAGEITDNTVVGINRGTATGCQEGNGIDVRNLISGASERAVTISGNAVTGYQKTGIVASGAVAATITDNAITGFGPVTHIAQNGIQVGFGATTLIRGNAVSGNDYTPKSWVSCGILLYEANGVRASSNTLFANERDLCNLGKGGGNFNPSN